MGQIRDGEGITAVPLPVSPSAAGDFHDPAADDATRVLQAGQQPRMRASSDAHDSAHDH